MTHGEEGGWRCAQSRTLGAHGGSAARVACGRSPRLRCVPPLIRCAQDLHQLVLVLADGRFHEKGALRAAVRAAAAKHGVCLAFIALDAAPAGAAAGGKGGGSSLLDMQSVSFVNGAPIFERYLDSFPFPYYIVLRDISALPRTLADLMRQWFELSRREG